MFTYILITLASLPLLGFLRASIDNKKPQYLIDIPSVIKKWQADNTWAARFSPLFSIFLFFYNLVAWMIYGFVSVFDFIAFIFRKIWWVVSWIWNEVLHPTVFAVVKLLWHYLVIVAWKFFQFTLKLLPETYKKKNITFVFKKLLFFIGVSTAILLVYLLTKNQIVLILTSLIIFYLFQYTVFVSYTHLRDQQFTQPYVALSLKLSILWLTMAATSTALLVALKSFSDVPIISGLNVSLIQVLLPIAILFGCAFLATTFYLPAFLSEKDPEKDFDVLDFIKDLLIRIPKLIVSRPFKILGMSIASILPFLFLLLINSALKEFSASSITEWVNSTIKMKHHIPSVFENNKEKKAFQIQVSMIQNERDSLQAVYDDYIGSITSDRDHVLALRNGIEEKKIHSLKRSIYIGENQSFSVPALDSCASLEWTIINTSNNNLIKREVVSGNEHSSLLFYHKWNKTGSYKVSLRSLANCKEAIDEAVLVEVIALPDDVNLADLADDFIVSREAADYAIDRLNVQLTEFEQEQNEVIGIVNTDLRYHTFKTQQLKAANLKHVLSLLTKILALFGLALILVLYLSVVWTYFLVFEFDIYSYEQTGKHYYQEVYEGLQAKNPNQPLLGIFVLMPILVLLILFLFATDIISDIEFIIQRYF